MSFGTEIKRLRTASHISAQRFADAIGIDAERLRKWEQKDLDPRFEDAQLIETFFGMPLDEIVKLKKLPNKFQKVPHGTIAEDHPTSYLEKRRKLKQSKRDSYMVPLVPVKAQAGYVKAVDQEVYVDTLEKYALPPGVNPQGALWRYWEIAGRSMEPEYREGDVLLTSQVLYEDWENLRNFYAYVIVTTENVMFKRVFCKNGLEWVLISENEEEFPQQLLPVEFIKEVWVVRRVIKNKLPPVKMFEIKV